MKITFDAAGFRAAFNSADEFDREFISDQVNDIVSYGVLLEGINDAMENANGNCAEIMRIDQMRRNYHNAAMNAMNVIVRECGNVFSDNGSPVVFEDSHRTEIQRFIAMNCNDIARCVMA